MNLAIRTYARSTLKQRGEQRNFITVVTEFIDAEFYIEQGIGNPNYHLSRAVKVVQKAGLSESDVGRANEAARALYQGYKTLPAKQQATLKENLRKKRLIVMERGFQTLMAYSDEEIKILNSNGRVDFSQDIVYQNSDVGTRENLRNRTLTALEYETILHELAERQDKFLLDSAGEDTTKLKSYAMKVLSHDRTPHGQIFNRELFAQYVLDLLNGQTLSKRELQSNGLNPEAVFKRARTILTGYKIKESERERLFRNPTPEEMRLRIRTGTDPIAFEEGWSEEYLITRKPRKSRRF